jgi:hypothetical protein
VFAKWTELFNQSITLSPLDYGEIAITGSNAENIISKNGTDGKPTSLSLSAPGFTDVTWYVDGVGLLNSGTFSGDDWPIQNDGRRKSPDINDRESTKTRFTFTSTISTTLTINLFVSSETGYDWAFVGGLDQPADRNSENSISGSTNRTFSIEVSPGTHFVEIGYSKDSSNSYDSDCAWFTIEVEDGAIEDDGPLLIEASNYGTREHSIIFVGYRDNIPYSREITFRVIN